MDLSNKSLAFILVVAIVVSLGGTMISMNKLDRAGFTGLASSNSPTGTSNLTIEGSLVLTFIVDNVNFGTGYTNDSGAGIEQCLLATNGSTGNPSGDCVNFNSDVPPFVLRNEGNRNLTVELYSSDDADAFIGGSSPLFQYIVENNESGSCLAPSPSSWTSIPTVAGTAICPGLGFDTDPSSDEMRIHIKVSIPQDAVVGAKLATLTATGVDI